ncbi:MAG: YidC/Oxa1 family membrane protein insertase [Oscillospiraceae bacterium]|nr:YidC/Oxa1 family membrane protein insertase [Oscillospiraceae bacterium]
MGIFGILAGPLGIVMRLIYNAVQNYGVAIILFTLLIRVVLLPLMLSQQKNTARMSVFQPMIQELQKKYAKDQQRLNDEMLKLQQEHNFNPTAGCAPMFLNLIIMFGVIEMIYRPLQYVLQISSDTLGAAVEVLGMQASDYRGQVQLINVLKDMDVSAALTQFPSLTAENIEAIQGFQMELFGINLAATPELAFNSLLIFPILSAISMFVMNAYTMKGSAQQMQGSMKYMPLMMNIMFVWISFTLPVGFSLYYTISNVLALATTVLAKKIYDPEKMKAEIQAEVEAKRKEKKKKKQVTVKDDKGNTTTKEVTEQELARIRLEAARAQDAEKYKDERTERLS